MQQLNKTRGASTRLSPNEARDLRRACRELRVRRAEFVRRAIARMVAETLAKREGRAA